MKLLYTVMLIAAFAFSTLPVCGQTPSVADFNLDFEKYSSGAKLPDRWMQWGTGYSIAIDSVEKKSGNVSISMEPAADKPDNSFGAVGYALPADYAGKEVELRGYMKFKDVDGGYVGLMLRIDGDSGQLQFDNMKARDIKGTSDWAEYSVKLPLSEKATAIYVGAVLTGSGKLWVDGLQVLIDGQDIKLAKPRPVPVFKASADKEFDQGSKITLPKLDRSKVESLTVLGKVWGFLKYHHPTVARGDVNWDYELFRVMPKILAAKNTGDRNEILFAWAESLGAVTEVPPSVPVSGALPQVKLQPELGWINDKILGKKLAGKLKQIEKAQREDKHYYIGLYPNVNNPQFKNEQPYSSMAYPDAGFRLLALYRYWNIIQYYFPNRHLIDGGWDPVMADFVPRFADAADELEYKKAALQLIGRIQDTHANIWGKYPELDKFRGLNTAAARATFVEDKAVIAGFWDASMAEGSELKVGDVIETIDGKKVAEIVKERLALTPASNYPTQLRDISVHLLQTNAETLNIKYVRDGVAKEAKIATHPTEKLKPGLRALFSQSPTAFKMIGSDIGYLLPGVLKQGEIKSVIPDIAKTKGLVIDLRSYPSEFIVFSLGEFLMPNSADFVKFTAGSVSTPGRFIFRPGSKVGKDNPDSYKGKIVILINETTQSQAEYTTMAFRQAPRTTVIGSTTAGADGNVSEFFLPGGIRTMISGIGVYYPDGRETQRVGIIPDIVVKPTLKGIKEGRDELLEKALEIIGK